MRFFIYTITFWKKYKEELVEIGVKSKKEILKYVPSKLIVK